MKAEIKNNMYHSIPLMRKDGTQINLGSRKDGPKRKMIVESADFISEQLGYLSSLNIISLKTIRRRGTR